MTKNKNETSRVLRVNLTDPQKLELGQQLAQAHNETAQIESDFQRIKDEFKSKLSVVAARIVHLSNSLSTGYEMKVVVCEWLLDIPTPGKKRLIRKDVMPGHLDMVVEECDMEEAEKTPELPLNLENPVLPATTGIAADGTVKVGADGPATSGEQK